MFFGSPEHLTFVRYEVLSSSVASFLVWGGGGGQDSQMYRQKKKSCTFNIFASERLQNIYIFRVSKYICIHIQSMEFPFITCGMVL